MSSGTATTIEPRALTSAVTHAMTKITEGFTEEQKVKLSQWIEAIEDTAETKVQNLTPQQLKRRDLETVAAAAIYDTFIEYESRTDLRVGLNLLESSLNRTSCSINNAWKKLFDNRVFLRGAVLNLKYEERDGTLDDVISNVIQVLWRAVDSQTEEVRRWLQDIEKEALEISATLPPDSLERYDVLLVANSVIYAAAKQHRGKMVVQFGQRDLSLLGSMSPAMISKCWLDLFDS